MNAKSPPPWDPAMSPFYPFRRYAKDLILWSLGADVQQQQQAASAVLQLSGGARALADELNVTLLMVGQQADWGDGRGDVIHPGIEILLRRLGERFGELESEMTIFRFYRHTLFASPLHEVGFCHSSSTGPRRYRSAESP